MTCTRSSRVPTHPVTRGDDVNSLTLRNLLSWNGGQRAHSSGTAPTHRPWLAWSLRELGHSPGDPTGSRSSAEFDAPRRRPYLIAPIPSA